MRFIVLVLNMTVPQVYTCIYFVYTCFLCVLCFYQLWCIDGNLGKCLWKKVEKQTLSTDCIVSLLRAKLTTLFK